jgi:hypothetical protein
MKSLVITSIDIGTSLIAVLRRVPATEFVALYPLSFSLVTVNGDNATTSSSAFSGAAASVD